MKILIFRINSYVKFKANIIVKYWNFPALLLNLDSYGKMKIYKSIVKILHPFESRKRLLLHLHYTSFTADFLPLFIRSKVHYPSHASKKDYLFKPFYAYAPHMTKK